MSDDDLRRKREGAGGLCLAEAISDEAEEDSGLRCADCGGMLMYASGSVESEVLICADCNEEYKV